MVDTARVVLVVEPQCEEDQRNSHEAESAEKTARMANVPRESIHYANDDEGDNTNDAWN